MYFWLHWVFIAVPRLSLVVVSGGYSSLQCVDVSLQQLLLLQSVRAPGKASHGLSSRGSQAVDGKLGSCGSGA